MSRARFSILSAGCLLTLLGLLFPQCSRSEDLFGPGPMWLMYALKSHSRWQDRVTIEWLDMAAEFGVIYLLTGVFYGTTYLRGRAFRLLIGLAACGPILVGFCTHPLLWIYGMWFFNYNALLWTEGYLEYLLVAFVVELCLIQNQKREFFAECILLRRERAKLPRQFNRLWPQLSTDHKILIGLLSAPAYCLVIVGVQIRQEAAHIAVASHIKAEALTFAYERMPAAAARQFDHKYVVVTGIVNGADAGLLGDGDLFLIEIGFASLRSCVADRELSGALKASQGFLSNNS